MSEKYEQFFKECLDFKTKAKEKLESLKKERGNKKLYQRAQGYGFKD